MATPEIIELTLGAQGMLVVLTDPDFEVEGVASERTLRIERDALGTQQLEVVQNFLLSAQEWVGDLLKAEAHGPYDNPEEVAKWGEE